MYTHTDADINRFYLIITCVIGSVSLKNSNALT